jgi:SAM-dependent methyltransferase
MQRVDKNYILSILSGDVERPEYLDFRPPADYVNAPAISSREQAIEKGLHEKNLGTIAGFQGLPPYKVLQETLDTLRDAALFPDLRGIGLELGAGLALFSIACLERDITKKIDGIVALEAVKTFVEKGIKKASAELLDKRGQALLPCYGVFEDIPVEDGTFDFVIQIESLHHAEDLNIAIQEVSRVVKKGGILISLDRSWIDSTSRDTLEEMLDHVYSREWLKSKKFDYDRKFTRRDNGEHEYTDKDWIKAFESNDFQLISKVHLQPKIQTWHLLKRIICLLKLSRIFGIKVQSRAGVLRSWIDQSLKLRPRIRGNMLRSPHPRPLTLFVLRK